LENSGICSIARTLSLIFKQKIYYQKVAKWLNSKKGRIKETLVSSYKNKIDYIIKKSIQTGEKGKPKEIILLTPKCFKMICMSSKTKKSIQVREYYIAVEEALDKYKNYIIKGLEENPLVICALIAICLCNPILPPSGVSTGSI
jgi:hypothetical protein